MRSFLLLAVTLLCAGMARAQASGASARTWAVDLFLLNSEMRYERAASQQYVDRRPLNLALGLRRGSSLVLLEYAAFQEDSGNNTLSIERRHQESTLWWKESVLSWESMDFFLGVGLGAYQEKLQTTLAGTPPVTDRGAWQIMGGSGVGLQGTLAKFLVLSVEVRVLAGENFDPNPQGSLLGRLGIEF